MHTVFALLCFVVVIHWLIFPYPSGLLHWHCGNLTIAPVPAKQPWWIWINTSCEFIMNDCITTTKQSTTKPCAYFLGYIVRLTWNYGMHKLLLDDLVMDDYVIFHWNAEHIDHFPLNIINYLYITRSKTPSERHWCDTSPTIWRLYLYILTFATTFNPSMGVCILHWNKTFLALLQVLYVITCVNRCLCV